MLPNVGNGNPSYQFDRHLERILPAPGGDLIDGSVGGSDGVIEPFFGVLEFDQRHQIWAHVCRIPPGGVAAIDPLLVYDA
jgi:hypothetical protein